jgi:membrane protease YdiL (CAAX protease family)
VTDVLGIVLLAALPVAVGLFAWRRWYDLGTAPPRRPVFSPPAGMGLFLAMLMLGMAGTLVVRYVLLDGSGDDAPAELSLADTARLMLGGAAGQAIVVAIYAWFARRAPRSGGLGHVRAAVAGAGGFLLAWPLVASTALVAGLVVERITGEPNEAIAHQTLLALIEGPRGAWFAVMVAVVVIVVPVAEEVMYRGILQRTMVEMAGSRWVAILVTSIIFALMHWGAVAWHALLPLFVLSLAFGWIYERTGRLSASIVMHVLFNAVNVALAGLAPPPA